MTTSEMPKGQHLLMPLLNLRFRQDDLQVTSDLSISRVTDADRARWAADPEASRLTVPEELETVTHAIYQRHSDVAPPLMEITEPAEDLFTLIGLLELRMPERLRAPFIEWTSDGLGWPPAIYELPTAMRRWQQKFSTFVRIDDETLDAYWANLTAPTDSARRLRRALGRATSARAEFFAEEVIMASTIGLECLFSPDTEGSEPRNNTNIVVGSTVEWCLGPEPIEPAAAEDQFNEGKRQYRIRSMIVHGKALSDSLNDDAKAVLQVLQSCVAIGLEVGSTQLGTRRLFEQFTSRVSPEFAAKISR